MQTSRPDRLPWWLGGVLAAGCFAIYLHTVAFEFVAFDDDHNIIYNPHLGPLSAAQVKWAFTDWEYMRRYLPLGWLGLSALFGWFGLNPAGYHAASVLLHVANSLLLFFILLQFLRSHNGPSEPWWRILVCFAAAVFWSWHPLRVETVAWASGLLYGQAIFFLFAAIWLHIAGAARWHRVAENGCIACSLLTYPIALGAWPVLMILDAYRGGWRRAWRRNMWCGALTVAVLGVTIGARISVVTVFPTMPTWEHFPIWQRIVQASAVYGHYLWRPWLPVGLSPVDPVLVALNDPSLRLVISAILPVGVAAAVISSRRSRASAGPWLFAWLVVLFPVLGLTERPHVPSDRYSFFAHAILAVAIAFGLYRLQAARTRLVAFGICLLIVVALAVLSRNQCRIWRDSETLWAHIDAQLAPDELLWLKYVRPAYVLLGRGDVASALARVDSGLQRVPHDKLLQKARENILAAERDRHALVAQLRLAHPPPLDAILHYSVALQCLKRGDEYAAAVHLAETRRLAPEYFTAVTDALPSSRSR